MKVLDFGSLNYDYIYRVDHIIQPGETEFSQERTLLLGGKGLNQAIAIARAGTEVFLAGQIGEDGELFLKRCKEDGIDTSLLRQVDGESGHTIIQLDKNAQNSIILFGGANRSQTREYMEQVISGFDRGDLLVLQNEINLLGELIELAHKQGMRILLNPSPFDDHLKQCDLQKISIFVINEVEGFQLTGKKQPEEILEEASVRFPHAEIVLTLGPEGAVYRGNGTTVTQEAFPCDAVDTTGAGDTFLGYLVAGIVQGLEMKQTLRLAAKAASIACTRLGATDGIPYRNETEESV